MSEKTKTVSQQEKASRFLEQVRTGINPFNTERLCELLQYCFSVSDLYSPGEQIECLINLQDTFKSVRSLYGKEPDKFPIHESNYQFISQSDNLIKKLKEEYNLSIEVDPRPESVVKFLMSLITDDTVDKAPIPIKKNPFEKWNQKP